MSEILNYANHDRHFANCRYVYPVVSRRSEGVSLGINLNLNRSCNWRCIYCQVENLVRGKPEDVNLAVLEAELIYMLEWITTGDFMESYVAPELRFFKDICIAGNGEPTLSPQFAAVCQLIANLRENYLIGNETKTVLITNGSQVHKPQVQEGLAILNSCNGEVWFKIDRVTPHGGALVNQVQLSVENLSSRLSVAVRLCKTYIQSCWFKTAGQNPDVSEIEAFVEFLNDLHLELAGVLLYSVARPPALAEGQLVSPLDLAFLQQLAGKFELAGYPVRYYL